MDYLDILAILKVAGFVVTAASTLWALTQKLSEDDASGRKRLTRAGWVALTFVIVGALTSVLSFDLESRRRIEDARVAQQRDAQRLKRLIVAGQTITSFAIEWQFSDVSDSLQKSFEATEEKLEKLPDQDEERFKQLHGVEREESFALLRRYWQLYPFFQEIGGAKSGDSSVVVVIALDNPAATVASFGILDYAPTPEAKGRFGEASRRNYTSEHTKDAGAGIEFNETVEAFFRMNQEAPRSRSSPLAGGSPTLTRRGSQFLVTWHVAAAHLAATIDRVSGGVSTSASLPDALRILVLYRLFDLPVRPSNFAVPLWRENYLGDPSLFNVANGSSKPRVPFGRSVLRIVPNEMGEVAATYDVEPIKRVRIANANPEIQEDYCDALVLVGKRRPDTF
ncbi:hypothetical protein [Reyranella sp.]|uniref:hypothetical protein n=1 Tax=Reyranella sp. TaxID=1929291 RepID=UPI003BA98B6E